MSDLIERQAVIDVVDSETVSTNPEHFKSSEKFIKFMDDSDISSFGKWQWANGFNTALVETRINLKKMPSAQPDIVRCKDCAKRECCRTSTVWAIPPKDDWYCADAERRTDD